MTREAIRTIPLDDQQYKDLRAALRSQNSLTKLMADTFMEIAGRAAEEETKYWDTVYNMVGDMDHTVDSVSINWVQRCIKVYRDE